MADFVRSSGSYAKFSVFLKQKTHFWGRSYKTTYGHEAVVLMSVVEGRTENICEAPGDRQGVESASLLR